MNNPNRTEQILALIRPSRPWTLTRFQCSDAMALTDKFGTQMCSKLIEPMPAGFEVVESGWDHEHCELCYARISESEGEREAWFDGLHDWVC